MQLRQIVDVLEEIAPTHLAESWDNVGLLVGDPSQNIQRVVLTIDYTSAVAEETIALDCQLVIAYHPPIFNPIKRLVAGGLIFDAVRRGISLYSPHTALDIATGGTNDMLADVLGLIDRQPLRRLEPRSRHYKLVTFVPAAHVDAVSQALFNAGCGQIGDYSQCSYRSNGTGTFFGNAQTNPTVGQSGQLEHVDEIRLELLVPIHHIHAALSALMQSHPYETPAYDLVQLAEVSTELGMGRIGAIKPLPRRQLIEHIRRELAVDHLLVAGPLDGQATSAACCAGACGNLLDAAIAQRADVYLTGEMRHHDALKAAASGMTVVCALHSNSERRVLKRLADRLHNLLPDVQFHQSKTDHDPFTIV